MTQLSQSTAARRDESETVHFSERSQVVPQVPCNATPQQQVVASIKADQYHEMLFGQQLEDHLDLLERLIVRLLKLRRILMIDRADGSDQAARELRKELSIAIRCSVAEVPKHASA